MESTYRTLSNLHRAIDWIYSHDMTLLPDGRIDIGGGISVSVFTFTTKETTSFEAHRKYIDIHYIISGEEKIITSPLETMLVTSEYSSEKDIALGECPEGEEHIIRAGQYCVTMPEEAHSPGRSVSSPAPARKAVFKVPV